MLHPCHRLLVQHQTETLDPSVDDLLALSNLELHFSMGNLRTPSIFGRLPIAINCFARPYSV
jgi:hypothetical protein